MYLRHYNILCQIHKYYLTVFKYHHRLRAGVHNPLEHITLSGILLDDLLVVILQLLDHVVIYQKAHDGARINTS